MSSQKIDTTDADNLVPVGELTEGELDTVTGASTPVCVAVTVGSVGAKIIGWVSRHLPEKKVSE
jgi:hypothetical protein